MDSRRPCSTMAAGPSVDCVSPQVPMADASCLAFRKDPASAGINSPSEKHCRSTPYRIAEIDKNHRVIARLRQPICLRHLPHFSPVLLLLFCTCHPTAFAPPGVSNAPALPFDA